MLRTTTLVIGLSLFTSPALAPSLAPQSAPHFAPDPVVQDGCGTLLDDSDITFARALDAAGVYATSPEGVFDVPIALHVVRRSDGSGGIKSAQLLTALKNLNHTFTPTGIRFFVQGRTDEIWDDNFYSGISSRAEIDALRSTNRVEDAINIYFTDFFASAAGSLCGISSYSFSTSQGIVLANGCAGVSYNKATFPHELGHYFDLYHTHETAFGAECSNGSNCDVAGDLICDTPADPQIGYHNINGGCNYIGVEIDPCTSAPTYAPDVLNVMSAAPRLCRTQFSSGQINRMRGTLTSVRSNLLGHCRADLDGSQSLDLFDFLTFQNQFVRMDAAADINLDTHFDVFDFLDFQKLFVAGCD